MRTLPLPLALSLFLAACSADAPAPPSSNQKIDPVAFFTGPSHGVGTISILFKGTQSLRVDSFGHSDGRGGIILDQTVYPGSDAPKNRRWALRPISSTTLTGALSDASGPVTGSMSGNALNLAFPMKGGLNATQALILQPGGRILINHMTVKKFGLTVATIEERITKG
jgi:hypothetical protein